jgi:hypothetical protein
MTAGTSKCAATFPLEAGDRSKEEIFMRIFMLATAAAVVLATTAIAQTAPAPTFSRAPDEKFLSDLDSQQLRIVRQASRGCPSMAIGAGKSTRKERDPCVTSSTDKAVADSGNPDLQAFHEALRPSDRYDEHRPTTVWQAWLKP